MLVTLGETTDWRHGTRRRRNSAMHLAAYRARDDVSAVVHAHPPVATAFAVAGARCRASLPEMVVQIG